MSGLIAVAVGEGACNKETVYGLASKAGGTVEYLAECRRRHLQPLNDFRLTVTEQAITLQETAVFEGLFRGRQPEAGELPADKLRPRIKPDGGIEFHTGTVKDDGLKGKPLEGCAGCNNQIHCLLLQRLSSAGPVYASRARRGDEAPGLFCKGDIDIQMIARHHTPRRVKEIDMGQIISLWIESLLNVQWTPVSTPGNPGRVDSQLQFKLELCMPGL